MRSAKSKGAKDQAYLAWLHTLPCVICWLIEWRRTGHKYTAYLEDVIVRCMNYHCPQQTRTEAAHVGPRGMGAKCPDRQAIPLCGWAHHREGPESQHKMQKAFWGYWGVNRDALVAALNAKYDKLKARAFTRDRDDLTAGKHRVDSSANGL